MVGKVFMVQDEETIPVIIGTGQINDRPGGPHEAMDPFALMQSALAAADRAASGGWLERLDSLAVVDQSSFAQLGDLSGRLAEAFGAQPRFCYRTATRSGVGPIRLLNEAADRIARKEIGIAAVVGAEALRTAARLASERSGNDPAAHNTVRNVMTAKADPYHLRYGLVTPTDIYPLYENASRAAWGQSLADAQAETGQIWSLFSEVASRNPSAWIQKAMSADDIIVPSAANRPIAYPYTKFMVANSSVNQGAGFLITSLALAKRHGIHDSQIIYVGHGAAASEAPDFLDRDSYARSASMIASLEATLEANAVDVGDLANVELYSCFPCVPKMARRVIGWRADQVATVAGSLTFAGAPIGNYMSHAVGCMATALSARAGHGLLFANGGLLTENHSILLSSEPVRTLPWIPSDQQARAEAMRGPMPIVDRDYRGPASIESFTVHYERDGRPHLASIVGRGGGGERFLAKMTGDNREGIDALTNGVKEPIGSAGVARLNPSGDTVWEIT